MDLNNPLLILGIIFIGGLVLSALIFLLAYTGVKMMKKLK